MRNAPQAAMKDYVIVIGGAAQDRWFAGDGEEDDGEQQSAPSSVAGVAEAQRYNSFTKARNDLRYLVRQFPGHSFRMDVALPLEA